MLVMILSTSQVQYSDVSLALFAENLISIVLISLKIRLHSTKADFSEWKLVLEGAIIFPSDLLIDEAAKYCQVRLRDIICSATKLVT